MRVYLTDHIKERMAERGISKKQIMECLQNHQVTRPGEKGKILYDYTDEDGYKTTVSAAVKGEHWIAASVWRNKTR